MINFDTMRFRFTGGRKKDILDLYDLVRPQTFPGLRKLRLGNRVSDGGYVMADDFEGITAAFSLGIGRDISWDIEMTGLGIDIYQFDHTVEEPPEVAENPRLHFHKCGIAGKTDPEAMMKSIKDILADEMAAHTGDLILKIDIDGHEWEVFDEMPDEILARFRQICIEIHNPLGRPSQPERRVRNLGVLRKINAKFAPVHLHANNAGPVRTLCGLEVPKLLEITYVRRNGQQFTDSTEPFPGELDIPNVPADPEIMIGDIVRRRSAG